MSDNTDITRVLGPKTKYPTQYDKSILVREPRSRNRQSINIDDNNLPFVGFDTWNAYEISTLNQNGRPVSGIAKIVYSCDSKYIVESKSLKLYLNSFNMTIIPYIDDVEVFGQVREMIESDLSDFLETDVRVGIFTPLEIEQKEQLTHEFYEKDFEPFKHYKIDNLDITVEHYSENPDILKAPANISEAFIFQSSLLFSRCKVTSQPDHGDVYIIMTGTKDKLVPKHETMLKYISSFRDECHFHEEICETIYKRLWDIFEPVDLFVTCLYTRRGGIDINPCRVSNEKFFPINSLYNTNIPHIKTERQ